MVRFRCPSRRLVALCVLGLLGASSLANGQTPVDAGQAGGSPESSAIDPRQVRTTSTAILRSASELAQMAVSLSSKVARASESEAEGSENWVRMIGTATRAFSTKLEENADHLAVLEAALGSAVDEQATAPSKAGPETERRSPAAKGDATAPRDDLAVALAVAKRTADIEIDARKAEADRRMTAEAEADALQRQVAAANERIAALQQEQGTLEAQSAEARTQLDQTNEKLDQVEREFVLLEGSFEDCRQGLRSCNQEKAALDPSDIRGKLETAEDQLAALLAVRDDLSAQVQDATSTAEQCAAILSRSDDRLTPALTEIERLEAELAAERRKNEALVAELASKR